VTGRGSTIVADRRIERTKTSSAVVNYVLEELFEGRLRSGDRIDLDEVSEALGISRLPVREALVMLERDGIVSTTYHRGVFVEPFDAASIIDDFEILGLLSGVAVRRLAEAHDGETVAALQQLIVELRAAAPTDKERTVQLVRSILTLEHRAGGSRRLRAELRAYTGFLPWAFRLSIRPNPADVVKAHARVVRAIAAGDGERAARYRLEDFRDAGKRVAREMERRGILAGEPAAPPSSASVRRSLRSS
jgi:DNA-binding GntR family transcriptional regulator